jgi:hypothetical protein
MPDVTCSVCGVTQWATADCIACGHPLPSVEDGHDPDGPGGDDEDRSWD